MSNNLVSQYPMSDRQMVQMEHGSDSLDFPVSEMPMKMAGQVPNNHESHHFYVSGDQRGLLESIPSGSGFITSLTSNDGSGNNDSSGVSMGSNQVWMSDQLGQEHANSPRSIPGQRASFPAKRKAELEPPLKRKAELEPPLNSPTSQQLPQSHKRPAHMGSDASSTGFLQPSSQQRRTAQMQSRSGPQVMPPQPNKKMMRNDSISAKSGLQRGQTGKRQTVQTESASKVRTESSDAVRSKMRESLAAALALAAQNQDNVSSTEKNQGDSNISHDPIDSQASHVSGSSGGGQVPVSGSGDVFPSNELSALNKTSDSQVFSAALPPGRSSSGSGGQTFQEFQYSLPDEDVPFGDNFFGKDDLLQGNGLSWAFDFDMHMGEGKEIQHQQAEKPASLREESPGDKQEIATLTPEDLAFDIETELFKLFGGANKKYREKGRSLLFNLKDRNNPELRERVMSGEISPQRLCSMSAEELASKELSEWRQAKAEELAQMKVLPETEVDIRSLVRKTHKGEFQVEVEHDDAMAAEISGGTSVLTRPQRKKSTESDSPSGATAKDKEKVAGQGSSSEGHDFSGSLVIPTDGTDPMQGMMVDELKDSDLPPIVSLDEFMESLNNEPPFENLSRDAVQKSPTSHGESPKPASSTRASTRASEIRREASSKKASSVKKPDTKMDVSWSPAKETILPSDVPKGIWDGILQLNISSSITVAGLFRSGEKTSTKEWPTSLEIKGRVRLDAFEKFLQELPMSRTRAVMVLHFVLRDKSSEEQLSNLSEAISSYIADERLGYAEPVPGVELYLCPPASRMFDMLNKDILKELPESDKTIENGLVGVVVWRRPHITNTISPNSSSHQKHAFKKQHSFPPPAKRIQDSPNQTRPPQPQQDEDDDDIPPGFGPGAAPPKEDDDLPEFNFTAPRITPHNSLHKRPVDQVRELIKKYGQGGPSGNVVDRGIPVQPWNDDDDDIPEWRPQAPQPPRQQPYAVTHGHQPPPLHLRSSDRLAVPGLAQQPHLAPPGGARPQPPPGYLHGARWRQY